jgi:hypothetical protein
MSQMRQTPTVRRDGSRLPPLFSERPPAAQLIAGLIVPAAFGAICGILLGVSSPAYWGLQVLGLLGGVAAGFECRDAAEGVDRGLLGGLVFGSFILLAHAIAGTEAKADLGEAPGMLVVFTGIFGALLGALGGWLRAGADRRAQIQERIAPFG